MEKSKQYNLKEQIQRSLRAKIIDEYTKKIIAWSINEGDVNKTSKLEIRPWEWDQETTRFTLE